MPEDANPYAVAGLLSQFLQCLPEPLLTYDLYSDFLKVAGAIRRNVGSGVNVCADGLCDTFRVGSATLIGFQRYQTSRTRKSC